MDKLKPCPFCGGDAEIEHRHSPYTHWKLKWFIPRCKDTACLGRSCRMFQTEEAAAKAWNRRAADGQ